jgi:Tol biopolymer transport system component
LYDERRQAVTGPGRPIAPAARVNFRIYPQWDVALNSALAYLRPEPLQLTLTDRAGRVTVLREEPRSYHHPRFSPDGRRIALDITEADERDVWVLDVADRALTRLTVGEIGNDPFWSPDGRRIAYTRLRGTIRGIYVRNADGSGEADSVFLDANDRSSGAWMPNGEAIVSSTISLAGLWMVPLQAGRAEPIPGSRATEAFPAVSPDGRWLAYVSDESGRREVYVRPLRRSGGRRQVSIDGGIEPVWARSGRELFYRGDPGTMGRLISAAVRTSPDFDVIGRSVLFDLANYGPAEDHANFDVHPDGSRFVLVRDPRSAQIHLILNWPALLRDGTSPR